MLFEVARGPDCDGSSYLNVELWDLGELMVENPVYLTDKSKADKSRADPLLGMAQGAAPTAVYKGPSSWEIQPPQALFDTKGYELTAHYMQIQVCSRTLWPPLCFRQKYIELIPRYTECQMYVTDTLLRSHCCSHLM